MSELLLVIHDDPGERAILERVLAGAGSRVTTAAAGQEGLAAARSGRLRLLLLDGMMPHLNGYRTCRPVADLTDRS